ncbi:aldehyde dehydrogenase (NADP(+)) [Protaetiibacter intestinalis]|uniref:Aldehyde dehydrogenase (NADP(+)) n=1 Tax=Protaetiibacter intestinalis TaxID=2419774 RepID=A0A387BA26_9MICO|nr:aldehyde dehydrogenase (NADP(+)) [Protaetiibacter intestinalis]AYF97976.1 aldehyde dehydrogenase (NADP(+)) [Protaetiibacter intestinalis]
MSHARAAVHRAARVAPAFAALSGARRAELLGRIADALDARADELVAVAGQETDLPEARLRGELARTTAQLRKFGAVVTEGAYLEATVDHADPGDTPPRPDLRRMLRPIGPVAVFAASNFPFAFSVAGGDTASALAVGCPVIVKTHPGHPGTSAFTATLVAAALAEGGAPDGVFQTVEGFEEGLELVDADELEAVAFTGSLRGGRALLDRCTARERPIPFYGELGSLNPVVVTPDADAARGAALAAGLAGSFQLGDGQFCTKPGLVLVPEGSALEAALPDSVVAGEPRMLTPAIADGYASGRDRAAAIPGVEVLAGGGGATAPTVLAADAATLLAHRELLDEVFGPVTVLVRYRDAAALQEVLETLEGSLTMTLHAEPEEDVTGLADWMAGRAGRVLFGGWPTGVAVSWAQHHGGPWPATNTVFTSVGATAVRRFLRPVAYQDAPASALPEALHDDNPLGIPRRVDGVYVLPATPAG